MDEGREVRQIIQRLFQGSIRDLNLLKEPAIRERFNFTLVINVGSTPFVPRGVPTLYLPMFDVSNEDDPERTRNNWSLITDALLAATGEISREGKVLVVCDAGISRSVVFSAMVVSILEDIPMMVTMFDGLQEDASPAGQTINDELMQVVRTPGELEPSHELWKDAAKAIKGISEAIEMLRGADE